MECKEFKLPSCVGYVLGATMHGLISRQLLELLGRPNPLEACSCPTTSHPEYGAPSQLCKDTDTCCHKLKIAVPSALRDACQAARYRLTYSVQTPHNVKSLWEIHELNSSYVVD